MGSGVSAQEGARALLIEIYVSEVQGPGDPQHVTAAGAGGAINMPDDLEFSSSDSDSEFVMFDRLFAQARHVSLDPFGRHSALPLAAGPSYSSHLGAGRPPAARPADLAAADLAAADLAACWFSFPSTYGMPV